MRIAVGQRLDEFVARHDADVVEPRHANLRQSQRKTTGHSGAPGVPVSRSWFSGGAQAPDSRCVPQDARLLTLSQHLAQVALVDVQAIAAQHACLQGGTVCLAHGWQLGLIANEHQSAVAVVIDETDQIVHQLPACEDSVRE